MRAVVQRVHWAEVETDGSVVGRIGPGLLVYLGVAKSDDQTNASRLAEKVAHLRVFEDCSEKLNLSVRDVRGGVLAVPNFTLLADTRKGRRPAFVDAAAGPDAREKFDLFLTELRRLECTVAQGVFGAHMLIRSAADGPVNIVLDLSTACEPRGDTT